MGRDDASIMSADTVSSLYPDRPIRPLPKRRLRERLSPEVADSIQYPPAPQNTTPLFYYPYNPRDDDIESGYSHPRADSGTNHGRRTGAGSESDEDDSAARRPTRPGSDLPGHPLRLPLRPENGRHSSSQAPPSAASSADGYYDPFEITNNNKKRKIPTAGDTALSGSHGLHDSVLGTDPSASPLQSIEGHGETSPATSTPYYGCGSFASGAQNVSGPGRGRYGRVRNGRSPLRALSDSTNNWAGRNGKLRPSQWPSQTSENTGIISNAIANAEKVTSQQGQENISLLQQQQSTKPSPASTQFTFTCDSQVPGTLSWPGSDHHAGMPVYNTPRAEARRKNSQGTQTNNVPSAVPNGHAVDPLAQDGSAKTAKAAQSQAKPSQKKSRRRDAKELLLAAKARRRQTENQNLHNPPRPEDVWICEFCEYEAIFGRPPEALVRQYEIKDRKLRLQEEERRRLLEKAKMRSRKGKKGSKAPAKSSNSSQDRNPPVGVGHSAHMNSNHSQETHSEDYGDEDEYDDEEGYGPGEHVPLEHDLDPLKPRGPPGGDPVAPVGK